MRKNNQSVGIWMPVYIGDFLKTTNHMAAAETGAYIRLCLHYWTTGKPLPDDDTRLARITGQTVEEWLSCRPMVAECYQIEGGSWRNENLENDLQSAIESRRKASAKARKAGLASGKARQKAIKSKVVPLTPSSICVEHELNPSSSPSSSPIPPSLKAPFPENKVLKDIGIMGDKE
ncbi:MAG: DUF1376 domain-containing protein [Candidatus Sedimenticola sp. (ex Thyasira tokunagai)]